jgi:hypothetical protein
MTHITRLTARKSMFSLRIRTTILAGFVLIVLQLSVQAQWTNGNNINNTNSGNVGVGTTNPTQGKMVVSDTIQGRAASSTADVSYCDCGVDRADGSWG